MIFRLLGLVALALVPLSAAAADRLAVSTFQSLGDGASEPWLDEALADMVTTDLATAGSFDVVGRRELKSILGEQKLGLSDVVDPATAAELGRLVSAQFVLIGSHIRMGEQLRLDARIYDVSSGVATWAATVEGPADGLSALEKKLVLSLLRATGTTLTADQQIELLQLPTRNAEAVKANYGGVLAVDANDPQAALALFERAAEADPGFEAARRNRDALRQPVDGGQLQESVEVQVEVRRSQAEQVAEAVARLHDGLYVVELAGEAAAQPSERDGEFYADLAVPVRVTVSATAWRTFLRELQALSGGDERVDLGSPFDRRGNRTTIHLEREAAKVLAAARDFNRRPQCRFGGQYLNFTVPWRLELVAEAGSLGWSPVCLAIGEREGSAMGSFSAWTERSTHTYSETRLGSTRAIEATKGFEFNAWLRRLPRVELESVTEVRLVREGE